MKIRGQRECKDCGARWSYYETGSVECPDCGSLRSVGVDSERRLHTDSPAEFDLTEVRQDVDARPLREVADRAGDLAREYVRKRGFVRGGDLRPLDDAYLAAQELRHAADVVGRGLDLNDDEEWYFLALLRGADADPESDLDGDRHPTDSDQHPSADQRPAPDEVPKSMHPIRGLAYADAVAEYRREMADWVDEQEQDGGSRDTAQARDALEALGDHVKRVQALDGDVDADTAELLVAATRDVSRYVREGDDEALVSARDRFGRLAG